MRERVAATLPVSERIYDANQGDVVPDVSQRRVLAQPLNSSMQAMLKSVERSAMSINDAMKALAELLGHHSGILGQPGPNYLTSEDASARLLDAMPNGMTAHVGGDWIADADHRSGPSGTLVTRHRDRKTAIFLAALAWKGIEKPSDL